MTSVIIRYLVIALLFASQAAFAGAAQADDALARQIDAYLSKIYKADQPGAAVIVTKGGEVLFRKGYGLASVELGVPVDPAMVFRIGSMTKQFTAVAVMILVEEGKVGLDDPVTKYLPDYPPHGARITVRHLLNHTSGTPEITEIEEWEKHNRETLTPDEVIAFFKDKPLDFEPGGKWQYSNSGYLLLGRVIEKASGEPYARFLAERIFQPLGLEHSGVDDDVTVVPGHVCGYQRVEGRVVLPPMLSMSHPFSGGAIYSSVDDLARWDAALYTDAILSEASLAQCFTPAVLNDSSATKYGFGWVIEQFKGRRMIWHNGRINGYLSHALRLPDERLYVAILSNIEDDAATPIKIVAESVAAIALGEPFEEVKSIELSPEERRAYVGTYRLGSGSEPGPELKVVVEEGKMLIVLPNGLKDEIVPLSRTEFFVPKRRQTIWFELDTEGVVLRLLVPGQGDSKIGFTKIE
jgi:D-alanyl-D-alanine carboxypeptidase